MCDASPTDQDDPLIDGDEDTIDDAESSDTGSDNLTEGADHERIYTAAVSLSGKELGRGTGSSKKAAEAKAAQAALDNLT